HIRYDADHFPTDLMFEETGDRENYQGRYILRHPWNGKPVCEQARQYLGGLPKRFSREAINLAELTGWDIETIFDKMEANGQPLDVRLIGNSGPKPGNGAPWWQRLWPGTR
ncbi:MAG: hypothetical protein O7C63_02885, partial [Alphaproteobacteria bacterium]|nr:hypothetical protein [Alphaproteobacteria bacterium]